MSTPRLDCVWALVNSHPGLEFLADTPEFNQLPAHKRVAGIRGMHQAPLPRTFGREASGCMRTERTLCYRERLLLGECKTSGAHCHTRFQERYCDTVIGRIMYGADRTRLFLAERAVEKACRGEDSHICCPSSGKWILSFVRNLCPPEPKVCYILYIVSKVYYTLYTLTQ